MNDILSEIGMLAEITLISKDTKGGYNDMCKIMEESHREYTKQQVIRSQ